MTREWDATTGNGGEDVLGKVSLHCLGRGVPARTVSMGRGGQVPSQTHLHHDTVAQAGSPIQRRRQRRTQPG